MESERFEKTTVALLDKEPGVLRADLYHVRYEAQFGIDCFGDLEDGLIVASCKCYSTIKKGQMAQWSDDFLAHWDTHWRDQKVTKFILAVAAPTHSRARLADIAEQKARFAALGVDYEPWSPRQLQEKLRGHRGIVSQFLGSEWVVRLCGDADPPRASGHEFAMASLLQERVESLGEALATDVEQRVNFAASRQELGYGQEMLPELNAIRAGPGWTALSPALQARIIRLQGSIILVTGDVAEAQRRSDEADAIAPTSEPRLRALLALQTIGVQAALSELGTPESPSGHSLRAALLMNGGDLEGAYRAIELLADGHEKLRLSGHLALLKGDREAAMACAMAAELRSPDNLPVRRLCAIASYAKALSPLALSQQYVFPQPIADALVRQDDGARQLMAAALEKFTDLVSRAPNSLDDTDRIWRLACLCNLPGRYEDAARQAKEILERTPTSALTVGWIIARGLGVDLERTRQAIHTALLTGLLDANGPMVLEWLTRREDRTALLDAVESALTRHWSNEVDEQLRALATRLRQDAAPAGAGSSPRQLVAALEDGDPAALIAEFRRLRHDEPASPILLGIGDALASAGEWAVLYEGVDQLLAFGTAEASRLAAYAANNAGDATRTVGILAASLHLFPGARLPYDLRKMEAQALVRVGENQRALERAAALTAERQTVRDHLWEAQLRLASGDLHGAVGCVRRAKTIGEIGVADAIYWAKQLASTDLTLAQGLWRSMFEGDGLPDEFAPAALSVSYELGLEHEHPELMAAMQRRAAAGAEDVQIVDVSHVVEIVTSSRERAAQIDRLVRRGEVPIHQAAAAARANLAELYALDRPNDAPPRPIFIRTGARPEKPEDAPTTTWTLYLDITALLIAEQLDLLDYFEKLPTPIRIGPTTIPALLSVEEGLRHPQPRRTQAAQAILSLVGDKVGLIPAGGAIHVVHEPTAPAVGVAAIVSGLERSGWIDASRAKEARSLLNVPPAEEPPAVGNPIHFCEGTLEQIADAGLLTPTVEAFRVSIDPASLELTRNQIKAASRTAALSGWIARLRDRVAEGLRTSAYEQVQPPAPLPKEDELDANLIYRNLIELLQACGTSSENRLWIDDRLINSYPHAEHARVIGVFEVLCALRREGVISDDIYFDRLMKLRAGGALFIPILDEEVVRHLGRAPVVDGKVVETPALAALRRNLALGLIHQDDLRNVHPSAPATEHPSELPYLMQIRRLVGDVIVDRWNSEVSLERARAQSDWLWAALRTEQLPNSPEGQPPRDLFLFAAMNFSGLLSSAYHLTAQGDTPAWRRRAAYFDWVSESAVKGRFAQDPGLSASVGNLARSYLRLDKADVPGVDDQVREDIRSLTRVVLGQMPPALLAPIIVDPSFLKDLQLDAGQITVGDLHFRASEFWAAVQDAQNGEVGLTSAIGAEEEVRFELAEEGVFRLTGALQALVNEAAAPVLLRDPSRRDAAIRRLLRALDVPCTEEASARATLLNAEAASDRMNVVAELRTRAIPTFLEGLRSDLEAQVDVDLKRFDPPPARDWLRHLRWEDPVATSFGEAAQTLVDEVGLNEAAVRLGSLPIELSSDLSNAFASADTSSLTLIGRSHRLRALRAIGASTDTELAEAADALVVACLEHGPLLVALLRWASRAFAAQDGWPSLAPAHKHVVIWSFAERLTAIFVTLGAGLSKTTAYFSQHLPIVPPGRTLKLERGYDDSPLYAGSLSEGGILLAGLEYGLGERGDDLKLSDEQLRRLETALSAETDEGVRVARPERALSFINTAPLTWLSRPTPNAVVENAGSGETGLESAVARLEHDPDDPVSWTYLLVFGMPVVQEPLPARLSAVVRRLDLEKLISRANDPMQIIRHVAEVTARLTEADVAEHVLNKLFALSRVWLATPSASDFDEKLQALIEAGASGAKSYDLLGPLRLSQYLRAIFGLQPEAARRVRATLENLVEVTPISEAREIWDALLAARSN